MLPGTYPPFLTDCEIQRSKENSDHPLHKHQQTHKSLRWPFESLETILIGHWTYAKDFITICSIEDYF